MPKRYVYRTPMKSAIQDTKAAKQPKPSTNPVSMWLQYNPSYIKIALDMPAKERAKYARDPGYRWMRRGWAIAGLIILALAAVGLALK